MQRRQPSSRHLAACHFHVVSAAEVQLLPAGEFRLQDGRRADAPPFRVDAAIARRLIDQLQSRQTAFLIDYEHHTLHTDTSGQPAPAAGWATSFVYREGEGLFAVDVQWTDRAKALIDAGEYRYLSPVFAFAPDTGEVTRLLHAGLVNFPAIDGMAQLAARYLAQEDIIMANALGDRLRSLMEEKEVSTAALARAGGIDESTMGEILRGEIERPPDRRLRGFAEALDVSFDSLLQLIPQDRREEEAKMKTEIAKALGMAEDARPDDMVAAVQALSRVTGALREALGVAKDAAADDLVAAAKRGAGGDPDPQRYVPVETVDALRQQLGEVQTRLQQQDIDAVIAAAMDAGKLLPAQEAWARKLGGKDLAALKEYVDQCQPIAALRQSQSGGRPPPQSSPDGELSEQQLAICRQMGIDPDAYRKTAG